VEGEIVTAPKPGKIGVRGLSKVFSHAGGHTGAAETFLALSDIDLDVREGEFLAVVGPSGCGKSTLLDILAGLSPPSSGEVLLDGKPVSGPSPERGIVFQQHALLPWLTALDNVALPLKVKGVPKLHRHAVAERYIDLVGLDGFGDRYPHQLSGGMKQRVALARSLAYDPAVLLMDEPFAALDAQTREMLQAELVQIWKDTHKTIVFVTHGIDEAVYLGQRIVVMTSRPGRIKQIVDNPLAGARDEDDIRSTPEFGRLRHEIWSLLRDEVGQSSVPKRKTLVQSQWKPDDPGSAGPVAQEAATVSQRIGRRGAVTFTAAAVAAGAASLWKPHPSRGSDLVPLRILGTGAGWSASEIVIVAEENGFFRKEGLALDLVLLPPEQLTIALDAGITDYVPNSYYIYFINVKDKGLIGHQVVSTAPYLDSRLPNGGLFVREDSPIHGPADLRGKTIGTTVLQFASSWFTYAYLAQAGLTGADVNLVAVPAPQHEQVLVRGDVDAVYTAGAVEATLLKRGRYRRIFTTADVAPHPVALGSTIVKDDFIRRNPDIVRRYVSAIGHAIDWANHNQDRIIHSAIKKGRISAALAPFLYSPHGTGDYSLWRWPEHGLQSRDDVKFWIELSERIQTVPKGKFAPEDIYTDAFNPFVLA
jgi:NitT/TauT family transport system ATP-binding protein